MEIEVFFIYNDVQKLFSKWKPSIANIVCKQEVFVSSWNKEKNVIKTVFYVRLTDIAWTYLQLQLRQWGVGNVYLLVLFSWKVNIAENPIDVMGL